MANPEPQSLELARWAISIAIPTISGLMGVFLGGWLSWRRDRIQRRYDFIAKQLNNFYSPLLSLRIEVRKRAELREKISRFSDQAWRKLIEEASARGMDSITETRNRRRPEFDKFIDYENAKLREEILPAFRSMLNIFRENMWLAEPITRPHFDLLIEYVDIWDRYLEDAIPREVLIDLEHGEEKLLLFYKHLEEKHDELRARLAQGNY